MEFTIRNMMEQDKQEVLEKQVVSKAAQLKLRSDGYFTHLPQCRVMDRMRFLRMISEHA